MQKKISGKRGEDIAVQYLTRHGYAILCRNYKVRGGEIDVVCSRRGTLHFVEVKTRTTGFGGFPEEAVTSAKIDKLLAAIHEYLAVSVRQEPWQLDVIALEKRHFGFRIIHYKNIGKS